MMNDGYEYVVTERDVEGVLIPTGVKVEIPAGTDVTIFQSLGDGYTVNINGNLIRIAGKDGDALNKPVYEEEELQPSANVPEGEVDKDLVISQLKTCYDPEIPVNIYDLGLIYGCDVIEEGPEKNAVNVTMTLTAPGCGMGDIIVGEIREKMMRVPNVTAVNVELVFDPPWDRDKMSEEAKLALGMF